MFVDTFTVQYIRKLRKNNEDDESEPKRITPFISIFAGIILLICSGILIVAKSNFLKKSGIKMPHVKIPNVNMKVPNVKFPKMPNIKFPHVKMPKFPSVPHIHFNAERQQVRNGPPTDPIVAGEYAVRKLYGLEGVACPDGRRIRLWQDRSSDGAETMFGSTHGAHNVVGSMSMNQLWKKGNKYFTLARYNGNERGIVQIDMNTQVVEKINPGDGCLFEMRCVSLSGAWERVNGNCADRMVLKQSNCVVSGHTSLSGGVVRKNTVKSRDGKEIGFVIANNRVLEFYDTNNGCSYRKVVSASAGEV